MTRIAWGAVGDKTFQTGVDRGVLYPQGDDGVAWNGLISISESPSGGDVTPYYIDGTIYGIDATPADYAATVEAYTYPDEFEVCDGTVALTTNGLYAGYQTRKKFNLSYRTMVGDDVDGALSSYIIHLVYNAYASPTQRDYRTLQSTAEATTFTWDIQAVPVAIPDGRPTGHLMIKSSETSAEILAAVESILYGSDSFAPRMPMPDELVTIFTGSAPTDEIIVTDNGDGTVTISGSDDVVSFTSATTVQITSASVVDNGDGTVTASSS